LQSTFVWVDIVIARADEGWVIVIDAVAVQELASVAVMV
jgi:hypothetical protein